uniref:Winged helix Storkhead-box1 domain-containing protein n=1 Tax=Junco hyemalis TaxID=40217 RepID=A0A8C5JBQ5_JUNHY
MQVPGHPGLCSLGQCIWSCIAACVLRQGLCSLKPALSTHLDTSWPCQGEIFSGNLSELIEKKCTIPIKKFSFLSGDVSPALMNPLSQPGSVPLAQGICWTISGMNAEHVVVTQETLMEQLQKNYPGIAVPSHNALYNILGALIKERKIYHTGEGYFIVTPNTYLITNGAAEDNRRILLEDSCCCSSPSITDLANMKGCAHLVKESTPREPCYRCCHCFPDQNQLCEQRQGQARSHGSNAEGQRGCSELKCEISTCFTFPARKQNKRTAHAPGATKFPSLPRFSARVLQHPQLSILSVFVSVGQGLGSVNEALAEPAAEVPLLWVRAL